MRRMASDREVESHALSCSSWPFALSYSRFLDPLSLDVKHREPKYAMMKLIIQRRANNEQSRLYGVPKEDARVEVFVLVDKVCTFSSS